MSLLDRMSIMGIRSFGPEDHDKQLIEFFKPLTLILGPNGSGKTTLIECLRYITTGETPPNSDSGKSFVHNPNFIGEMEVVGQVKMQFKDVLGKKVVVTRNLKVTQTSKNLTLKTLDGTIARYEPNGDKSQISHKCAELDVEMIGSLGVSKPILNYVIFCHQEESNWPLSEGKALKQRFDDIFAATRYIKALEEIRKVRLGKVHDIKLFKAQVLSLQDNRRKAAEFNRELEKTQNRLAANRDTIQSIENKLKPISEKLKEITIKESEIGSLNASLDNTTSMIEKYEADEKSLKNSIESLFGGSKEDLLEEINDFDVQMVQRKKHLEKVKQKISELEAKRQQDAKLKSRLLEELGKLKSEHKLHEQQIASRDTKLRALRQSLGLGDLGFDEDEPLIESQVENAMRNLKQRNSSTVNELNRAKSSYEDLESNVQSNIDKMREEKAQMQQKLSSSNEQIAKNKLAIRNINAELIRVDSLVSRQDDLEDDLKEMEQELTSIQNTVDVEALRSEVSKKQDRKREMDAKLTALNQEMSQLQRESKTRTEIELVNKDVQSKQELVDKVLQRHKETIVKVLGQMPEHGIHDKFTKAVNALNSKVRNASDDLNQLRSSLSGEEMQKKFLMDQLTAKEKLLAEHRNKLSDVCGSQNFDEGFEALESTTKELQDEKGAMMGSLYVFNQYIERLENPRPSCPLCKRSFEAAAEAQALVKKLQRKLQQLPNTLEQKDKLIKEKQQILNRMLELKPIREAVVELSEKEIPDLKAKLEKSATEITHLHNKISEAEESLETLNNEAKIASDVVQDLYGVEQNQRELERLKRRLSGLTSQLGGRDVSRTIQQVSDEQTSAHDELKLLSRDIETMQQRISDHREQVQHLRGRINDINAEKNKITSDMQKKTSLQEQLKNMTEENTRLADDVKGVKTDISNLEAKLSESIKEKESLGKQKEQELEKIRKKISEEEREMRDIESLSCEINKYIKNQKEKALVEHEDKVKDVSAEIDAKMNSMSSLGKEERDLNKEISSQELKYRDLKDNLKLKETMEKIQELQVKCKTLQDKIGGYDIRSLLSEKDRLVREERNFNRERDESVGRENVLKESIRSLKKQLADEMFKNADLKHREMCIRLRTTEVACDDLNKYYTALNKAVINYHQMKMEEINKIIADLWRNTYSGNDIDFISIESNVDAADVGLEKSRRNYNYKVVAHKGDHPYDMRGRCSAGQKVLASLIIRLALAETFCLNCGILALDEPTTNLDRENISKLAQALIDIVNTRSEQHNFQLIIITHDEDFIEILGRSETVDYFYKVSKDEHTFSKVTKCVISDMN